MTRLRFIKNPAADEFLVFKGRNDVARMILEDGVWCVYLSTPEGLRKLESAWKGAETSAQMADWMCRRWVEIEFKNTIVGRVA